jgi:hypothetical protein
VGRYELSFTQRAIVEDYPEKKGFASNQKMVTLIASRLVAS